MFACPAVPRLIPKDSAAYLTRVGPEDRTGVANKKKDLREYKMNYEVKSIKMKDEFKDCPECGYKDGFHSMFKKDGSTTKWLFICPSCHSVFDIGFTVPG